MSPGEFSKHILNVSEKIVTNKPSFSMAFLNSSLIETKAAAVLVPLIIKGEEITIIFTKRSDTVAVHKGEISFPGGMLEPDDNSLMECAVRETVEEIGLDKKQITPLGYLNSVTTGTGFQIFPVLAVIVKPVLYKISQSEVASIHEIPLVELMKPSNRAEKKLLFNGHEIIDYRFNIEDITIWGATGRILHSYIKSINDFL
ncbi:MAG: CoA pyrophosphatase [Deltaproteobacteria bacterium]|nr:CoA pyrophosphatase [Deltaproteobacteria bacterium]